MARRAVAWLAGLALVLGACSVPTSGSDDSDGSQAATGRVAAGDIQPSEGPTTSSRLAQPEPGTTSRGSPRAVGGSDLPSGDVVQDPTPVALPAPLAAQIDGLTATVEAIRELEFDTPPHIVALAPEEVMERRAASLAEDFGGIDFTPEAALYRLFGVFDQPTDLAEFYTDFYSSSTLAFYDLDGHELVVPITGEVLTPYEQWIMVHELTHALLDQNFADVTARYIELGEQGQADAAGGLLGLIEGEAVLVQSLFYETLDSDDRSALHDQARQRHNETFAAAPAFFRSISRYPYTDGSLFALYLYRRGGMEAINQAYRQFPATTEAIMTPERYIDGDDPEPVALELVPPFGFEVVERGVWGARGWRSLFGQFLNGGTAAEAAAGWGGDQYRVLWNEETRQLAFVAVVVGDTIRDASEFGGAFENLVATAMDVELSVAGRRSVRFTGADYAVVERRGDRVLFLAATDPATGTVVRAALRGFD